MNHETVNPGSRTIEVNWALQRSDFAPDGSLRDIYVLETTAEDWSNVLGFLHSGPYDAQLKRNGVPMSVPEDVNELFGTADRVASLLLFRVAGVELACNFFAVVEIEFDFYPNTVGESELRALLHFVADIGDLTGKVVVMTPENGREEPFFRYEPGETQMTWIPST